MGCYPPLVKFVSRAIKKCNGRERWREERLDYAMAYPPLDTHYTRPVARTVTFASNNNVYMIPPQKQTSPPPQKEQEQEQSTPEPPQQPKQAPPQQAESDHHDAQPQPPEQQAPAEEKAPAEPKPPKGPKRGKNKKPGGRVRFGPEPPPPQEPQQDPDNAPVQEGQQQQHGGQAGPPVPAYLLRYTPSPLPRWEATPRRHEYFSGEYRSYYPTPVREGIYRIATDANRLTTIFSEENPNACAIV